MFIPNIGKYAVCRNGNNNKNIVCVIDTFAFIYYYNILYNIVPISLTNKIPDKYKIIVSL